MKAITNAHIFTMEGPPISNGTIIWEGSKIIEVGSNIAIPATAKVYDVKGSIVTPGLINSHSHAGLKESFNGYVAGDDSNETSFPITPHLNAIDGINPQDIIFNKMIGSGITTTAVSPGNTNLLGGSISVIKTVGSTIDEMVVKNSVGIKAAVGDYPKRFYGAKPFPPVTRMNIMAMLRQTFFGAKDYARAKKFAPAGSKIPYNLLVESLIPVITGQTPLFIHANRRDDIHSAIRLAKEFDIKIVLVNAMEAHLIADKLKDNNISCIVSPGLKPLERYEYKNGNYFAPEILHSAGVCTAIVPDSLYLDGNELSIMALMLRKAGLNLEQVIKTITLNPALILGIADRVGSIAKGKDADMIIYSGEPFSIKEEISSVIINGQRVPCEGGQEYVVD